MSGGEPPSGAPGQPLAALQGLAAGGETEAQGTQAPTMRTSCPLGREQGPPQTPRTPWDVSAPTPAYLGRKQATPAGIGLGATRSLTEQARA